MGSIQLRFYLSLPSLRKCTNKIKLGKRHRSACIVCTYSRVLHNTAGAVPSMFWQSVYNLTRAFYPCTSIANIYSYFYQYLLISLKISNRLSLKHSSGPFQYLTAAFILNDADPRLSQAAPNTGRVRADPGGTAAAAPRLSGEQQRR